MLQSGSLVGVFTERDILRAFAPPDPGALEELADDVRSDMWGRGQDTEQVPSGARAKLGESIPELVLGGSHRPRARDPRAREPAAPDRLESAWAASHGPLYATVTSFTMPSAACGVPSSAGTVQTIT